MRAGAPGAGDAGPGKTVPTGVRKRCRRQDQEVDRETAKVDSGAAPASKAKKPAARRSAPAVEGQEERRLREATAAAKKRTLAVVTADTTPSAASRRPLPGGGGVARQGQDHQEVPGHRLHGEGLGGPREGPAQEQDGRRRRARLQARVRGHPRQGEGRSTSSRRRRVGVDQVFLATDPDREGEAIAWHIAEELGAPQRASRVLFNEITKKAIQEAIAHPRELDQAKLRLAAGAAHPRPARRLPDLARCSGRRCGAGSPPAACSRWRCGWSSSASAEIKAFVPEEYWTLEAELEGKAPPPFRARLAKVDGKKAEVPDRATADALRRGAAQGATYRVAKVERARAAAQRAAPFITSKLQQEAANRLHFTAKKTMTLAQRLYEGVELGDEGQSALITYMRTDSTRLSDDAVTGAREFIGDTYGKDYAARRADRLQEPRRAPRTRTRPSARRRWSGPAGPGAAVPRAGHVPALRAHLEPLRGLPDEAGGLRPDHRGHRRRPGAPSAPRARS